MAVLVDTVKWQQRQGGPLVYRVRWKADTEEEAETGIPYFIKGGALMLVDSSAVQWHPGAEVFLVDAQYEGLLNDPPPELDEFTIDGEFREEKIESFPIRSLLVEQFGAFEKNNRLEFPRLLPKKAKTTTGVKAPGENAEDEENPLYNVRTYPVFYEVANWRFVRKQLPSFVSGLPGQIVERLPDGFEYGGDAKMWFCTKAPRTKRGGSWSVSVHYKAIDKIRHVAALQALINQESGQSGGLTITGLTLGTLS